MNEYECRELMLTRRVTKTIRTALEASCIILGLLEMGQSLNAFIVNVTKCKATAAVLLQPFPTHGHINLLLIYR